MHDEAITELSVWICDIVPKEKKISDRLIDKLGSRTGFYMSLRCACEGLAYRCFNFSVFGIFRKKKFKGKGQRVTLQI